MKITFQGAARSVTGSRYLLETASARIMIDCGMFQEREFLERNWAPFTPQAREVTALLLTHAHLDHCGLIPKLVKEGFAGRIHCTPATAEIAQIVMEDSGHIQEEDIRKKAERHQKQNRRSPHPYEALYTAEDAKAVRPLFTVALPGTRVQVAPGVIATWAPAGHILGACSILVEADGQRILFSGDVGRWSRPILPDPTPATPADWVLTESTYGDKVHDPGDTVEVTLAALVKGAELSGGNVVIPAFAVERTHELLYYLNRLLQAGKIGAPPVFLDSPSAISVTAVFEKHPEAMDDATRILIQGHHSPFDFPGLTMTRSVDESKALNVRKGTSIIIAGAGMCTGGRIKHHLVTNLPRPESVVLFVGFQGSGTLGRQLVDGATQVRIFGEMIPVRAKIARIEGFSGHGDRNDLLRWIAGVAPPPREVFVTHGEAQTADAYAATIRQTKAWNVSVPPWGESRTLSK